MAKLAVVGQDTSKMIDCSEAVPIPVPAVNKACNVPGWNWPTPPPVELQLAIPLARYRS